MQDQQLHAGARHVEVDPSCSGHQLHAGHQGKAVARARHLEVARWTLASSCSTSRSASGLVAQLKLASHGRRAGPTDQATSRCRGPTGTVEFGLLSKKILSQSLNANFFLFGSSG
ncbi:hypothetical protein V6N13_055109 [Hibiscus sabdariffa]|uniref:Uncharacterized protein n=1 Tax=Hibiscus sabdariffa TaxID=183260 RepID=A0ABR2DVP9_9ROSI